MRLAIVVPCYNEEEVLAESAKRLTVILERMINGNKRLSNLRFWSKIFQIVITVLTAIATTFGVTSCM